MSDNVVPFEKKQKEQEEPEHSCPTCQLAEEYFYMLLDALQNKELQDAYNLIHELVLESKDLGVIEYLEHELDAKAELLDKLMYGDFED